MFRKKTVVFARQHAERGTQFSPNTVSMPSPTPPLANKPSSFAGPVVLCLLVMLSHIAGFTRESRAAMEQLVCDNLAAFFSTGKVLTPV